MVEEKSILKTVLFHNFSKWDVKQFFKEQIKSSYPITFLSELLNEETEKKKLSKFPNEDFGILGISNEEGMFDAYTEKGKNINQPYKIIKNDFIAYNPYRVNVGSIGIKKEHLKNEYISNAYVVFSTKENLLADYLFLLMHTNKFNQLIRDNTTGSVRQTLSFENLGKIAIPVPSIPEQKAIVQKYQDTINEAEKFEKEADFTKSKIDQYFFDKLELNINKKERKSGLSFINFSKLHQWDTYDLKESFFSKKYPIVTMDFVSLSKPVYGAAYKTVNKISNIRYIRITDINEDGTLNDDIVSANDFSEQYLLEEHDFLFARSGATVGKTFLYELKYGKSIFAGYLIKFKLNKEIINPYYLLSFTKTSAYKQWIIDNMRVSAQPNINSQQYSNSPIVLPPLPVQNEIVEHINQIKAQVKDLRQQAKELREKAKLEFERSVFE